MDRMNLLENVSFRNFISKKFIGAYMSDESERKFEAWLNERGISRLSNYDGTYLGEGQPFGFHVTLAFSTNEVKLGDVNSSMGTGIPVKPKGFKFLGPNQDVPVMEVDGDGALKAIREAFISQVGIKETWPNWIPHISLSYDKAKIELPKDLPDFDIFLDKFKVSS